MCVLCAAVGASGLVVSCVGCGWGVRQGDWLLYTWMDSSVRSLFGMRSIEPQEDQQTVHVVRDAFTGDVSHAISCAQSATPPSQRREQLRVCLLSDGNAANCSLWNITGEPLPLGDLVGTSDNSAELRVQVQCITTYMDVTGKCFLHEYVSSAYKFHVPARMHAFQHQMNFFALLITSHLEPAFCQSLI